MYFLVYFLKQMVIITIRFTATFFLLIIPVLTLFSVLQNQINILDAFFGVVRETFYYLVWVSFLGSIIITGWNTLGEILDKNSKYIAACEKFVIRLV